MHRITVTVLLALATACSSASEPESPDEPSGPGDHTAPLLTVETPVRGTIAEDSVTIVAGSVSDDSGSASVTVNGTEAEVTDGTFEATITIPPGMTLIQTVAEDAAGNQTEDVRAVLAGRFARQGTPVERGVVSHVNDETLGILGDMIETAAENADLEATAQSFNPLVDAGNGCFGVEIDLQSVAYSAIDVELRPVAGGVDVTVHVDDLDVDLQASYDVACIGGGAGINISADRFTVSGTLDLGITGSGDIEIDISDESGAWENFDLAVGAIPDAIIDLFEGIIDDRVADAIVGPIADTAPPMGEAYLAEFMADSFAVTALGEIVDVTIRPTELTFSPSGGRIVLTTSAEVRGVSGADYLVSPAPAPSLADMSAGDGLRVAVADDVANQILAGFWAAGTLDSSIIPRDGDGTRIFGPEVDHIDIHMSLPPTVTADEASGAARLTVGDLVVSAVDDDDGLGTVAEFVVSADIDLRVEHTPDGHLVVATDTASIYAKILSTSDALATILNDELVAALAEKIIEQVAREADDLLESLPIPTFGDVSLTQPNVTPTDGYLMLGASLEKP